MSLIPATKAATYFSEEGKKMDYRTFKKVVVQYRLTAHPVAGRIKYDPKEIERKLKIQPRR